MAVLPSLLWRGGAGGGAAGVELAVQRVGENGGGGGGAEGYLRERARWEPSVAAIRLQQAFAVCPRADAAASVTALAESGLPRRSQKTEAAWPELARDTLRASALYGQPGLPESGAEALWGNQLQHPGGTRVRSAQRAVRLEVMSAVIK